MSDKAPENTTTSPLTAGMSTPVHISYMVTIVANLMAFGALKDNVAQFGLTVRQWRILGLLGQMGPLTLSDIAHTVHHEKSTLSRAAGELERRNLIEKRPNIRHKNSPLLSFTASGQALYDEIEPIFTAQAEKFADGLTSKEQKQLCELLDKLKHHAEEVRAFEGWETV
ncbi:MarR family winged helix-turn-helix transcriptional regulator [Paremcibacter congregatus]|nr:MarR family transcriptional regulator [Paremcibacter congregatus]